MGPHEKLWLLWTATPMSLELFYKLFIGLFVQLSTADSLFLMEN